MWMFKLFTNIIKQNRKYTIIFGQEGQRNGQIK